MSNLSAIGIPFGAEINGWRFNVIPFEIGIHQRLCGLPLADKITWKYHSDLSFTIIPGLPRVHAGRSMDVDLKRF